MECLEDKGGSYYPRHRHENCRRKQDLAIIETRFFRLSKNGSIVLRASYTTNWKDVKTTKRPRKHSIGRFDEPIDDQHIDLRPARYSFVILSPAKASSKSWQTRCRKDSRNLGRALKIGPLVTGMLLMFLVSVDFLRLPQSGRRISMCRERHNV